MAHGGSAVIMVSGLNKSNCPSPRFFCHVNKLTVFNATLVLCGILVVAPKQVGEAYMKSESFSEDTNEAFRRGVKVMKDLDRGSAVISRCCNVLDRFAEMLYLSRESCRSHYSSEPVC